MEWDAIDPNADYHWCEEQKGVFTTAQQILVFMVPRGDGKAAFLREVSLKPGFAVEIRFCPFCGQSLRYDQSSAERLIMGIIDDLGPMIGLDLHVRCQRMGDFGPQTIYHAMWKLIGENQLELDDKLQIRRPSDSRVAGKSAS